MWGISDVHIDQLLKFLGKVGVALLIVVIGYIVIRIFCMVVKRALKRSRMDPVIHSFVINCMRVILWICVLLTALSSMGVSMTAFLTVVGAAGVAIALALQNSLGNFAGGLLIIINKPFSKGDYIEDYQTAGKVEKIDLLYTTLHTYDNKVITIPNGKLANSTVVNFSKAQNRRVDCNFQIGYRDDILHAKEILLAVAESDDRVFKEPEPLIGVSGHNDSSVGIDLKVWCRTEEYWNVKYYLEEQVKIAFDEAGISIPFPQMDVHVKRR